MTTTRKAIGSRRIPIHDHYDLNSGGKLTVSGAISGGLDVITGSIPPGSPTAAAGVSILDLANYFEGTTLEEVLAEIGGKVVGVEPHGDLGAAETFDAATGWHSGTLDANCTFTLTANPTGTVSSLFLRLTQDGTGGWTITLPASVTNKTALEASQVTTLSTTSLLVLLSEDGGTTWFGGWWGQGGSSVTALDDLTDVTITAPAEDDDLRYNGSVWVNDSRKWEVVTNGEDVFVWEDDDLVYEWSA